MMDTILNLPSNMGNTFYDEIPMKISSGPSEGTNLGKLLIDSMVKNLIKLRKK